MELWRAIWWHIRSDAICLLKNIESETVNSFVPCFSLFPLFFKELDLKELDFKELDLKELDFKELDIHWYSLMDIHQWISMEIHQWIWSLPLGPFLWAPWAPLGPFLWACVNGTPAWSSLSNLINGPPPNLAWHLLVNLVFWIFRFSDCRFSRFVLLQNHFGKSGGEISREK